MDAEGTLVNSSLADLANRRANAVLAAQKAEREVQAAKEEADQRKVAREIDEKIKAMELQRRIGSSPSDRSTLAGDSKSHLVVLDTEQTSYDFQGNANIEQFQETIQLGDEEFNAVRLSCPRSSTPFFIRFYPRILRIRLLQ